VQSKAKSIVLQHACAMAIQEVEQRLPDAQGSVQDFSFRAQLDELGIDTVFDTADE